MDHQRQISGKSSSKPPVPTTALKPSGQSVGVPAQPLAVTGQSGDASIQSSATTAAGKSGLSKNDHRRSGSNPYDNPPKDRAILVEASYGYQQDESQDQPSFQQTNQSGSNSQEKGPNNQIPSTTMTASANTTSTTHQRRISGQSSSKPPVPSTALKPSGQSVGTPAQPPATTARRESVLSDSRSSSQSYSSPSNDPTISEGVSNGHRQDNSQVCLSPDRVMLLIPSLALISANY